MAGVGGGGGTASSASRYVAFDNSGVLPCPVGMSCPGGLRV